MPKLSPYHKKKSNELKRKAVALYKEGFNLRETGKIIGKSHEWVRQAVKKF